ncbi:hypothetical protein TNCV_1479241 [Trichonephila clavipes]|nr:hypothetical protein TNCV_1479241 [Trichonephila clavipes]
MKVRKREARLYIHETVIVLTVSIPLTFFALSGSLVVKATDLRLAFHEFEPGTAEDPPCRGGQYTLNLSRLKHPLVGVEKRAALWFSLLKPQISDGSLNSPSFDTGVGKEEREKTLPLKDIIDY